MAELANEEKPAIAPPVFLFQKDKAQKRSADGSSAEDDGSDKEDGGYCPPVKRERTSSLTQFPPSHSGSSKNNVFMPSSFCPSPTGNSEDSEPDEKPVGFRLKPPTLIHGQAPSSGVPSQKPKEQQRSVLRPALLQAPPVKSNSESTNGVKKSSDGTSEGSSIFQNNTEHSDVLATSPVRTTIMVLSNIQRQKFNLLRVCVITGNVTESLEESAAAYTKATAKKCILEKVDVKTGEESESNVLQVQCKLFVFDKTAQTWIERGRGLLRLNDMASTDDGSLQSRLVMRTQGSLRLILNTKLWPQMQVDKASEKSVRVTAMDTEDQGVKVFLISPSSREDTGQLAAALHHRILALKSRADQEPQEAPSADCAPEADLPHSEGDSDEEDQVNNAAVNSEGGEAQAAGST
uniref:Ran-binding protein 3-like n=1 Tax=Salmo trutta TaxID=8032 RepID=A0A673YDV4_SALTR